MFASRARRFFFLVFSRLAGQTRDGCDCGGWAFFNMEMEGPPPLAREPVLSRLRNRLGKGHLIPGMGMGDMGENACFHEVVGVGVGLGCGMASMGWEDGMGCQYREVPASSITHVRRRMDPKKPEPSRGRKNKKVGGPRFSFSEGTAAPPSGSGVPLSFGPMRIGLGLDS